MAQIGIKLADHSFYPVLDDDTPQRKRMVLAVARDGQKSVQVDLIRRREDGDQSVGCLVLEELNDAAGTELEFVLGVDGDGNVEARISDPSGDQYQSFSVRLDQLDIADTYSLPDSTEDTADIAGVESINDEFDDTDLGLPDVDLPEDLDLPDDEDNLPASFSDDLAADLDSGSVGPPDFDGFSDGDDLERDRDDIDEESEAEPRRFNALLLIAIILFSLSVIALGAFGIFNWLRAGSLPELRAAAAMPYLITALL
ncbi:MAG: hypothetical protein PF508_22200 [Spirochaeta sp.]|nr:hypothetical protein [Spirochaeta sp.]